MKPNGKVAGESSFQDLLGGAGFRPSTDGIPDVPGVLVSIFLKGPPNVRFHNWCEGNCLLVDKQHWRKLERPKVPKSKSVNEFSKSGENISDPPPVMTLSLRNNAKAQPRSGPGDLHTYPRVPRDPCMIHRSNTATCKWWFPKLFLVRKNEVSNGRKILVNGGFPNYFGEKTKFQMVAT